MDYDERGVELQGATAGPRYATFDSGPGNQRSGVHVQSVIRLHKRGHQQLGLVCQPQPYQIKSVIQIPSPESKMQDKHFPILLLQSHSQNLEHYM